MRKNNAWNRTANVLIKDTVAKVADFGISKVLENQSENTVENFPWRWTAPEVQKKSLLIPVSSKCDVYSFGVLIYEALNKASRPFSGYNNRTVSSAGCFYV